MLSTDSDGDGAPDTLPGLLTGTWVLDGDGAAGVGPSLGNTEWWQSSEWERPCWYDDRYVFDDDGTFSVQFDGSTFIESWQNDASSGSCQPPVFPHDETGSWSYQLSETLDGLLLEGLGAFIGLPKVMNGYELSSPDQAPSSVEYIVDSISSEHLVLLIESEPGIFWAFRLKKTEGIDYFGPGMSRRCIPE